MPNIASTLQRRNNALFAIANEADLKISRMMVADDAARDAIPTYVRTAGMEVKVLASAEAGGVKAYYELESDLATWTEISEANYILSSEKGSPNGVAVLDADGYIDASQIKNLFISTTYIVADQTAMLALTTTTGNVVMLTDGADAGKVFLKLNNDDPALIGDFAELTSSVAVSSVKAGENGTPQTGSVVLTLASLLTATTDFTLFNTKVGASPSVSANTSAISTIQSDIGDINTAIALLQGLAVEGITIHEETDAYDADRFVWANASVYRSLQSVPEDTPITDTDYWEGGVSTFIGQGDTPSTYAGQALRLVRVNSSGTALEFVNGLTLYAPISGSSSYWKTSGPTILGAGAVSVSVGTGSTNSLQITKSTALGGGSGASFRISESVAGNPIIYLSTADNINNREIYVNMTSDATNGMLYVRSSDGVDGAEFYMKPGHEDIIILGTESGTHSSYIHFRPGEVEMLRIGATDQYVFLDNSGGLIGSSDFSFNYVDNSFVQRVYVLGAKTYSEKQTFLTSTTSSAALNIPHGVAPTSPVNGDMWTTSAGLYIRVSGTTVGPLGTGVGSATSFTALTDTPGNYTSASLYLLRVNSGGTAVEFVNGATLYAPVIGSTNYAPASGSANYWKVAGPTAISGSGAVTISQAATSSSAYISLSRTGHTGNISTLTLEDSDTALSIGKSGAYSHNLQHQYGNFTYLQIVNSASSDRTLGVLITPSLAHIGISQGAVIGKLEFTASEITLRDDWGSVGLRYYTDYSTGGKALGDRWIPDWYSVRAAKTFTGKQTFAAGTTDNASINMPHGQAPASPVNGDIWTTATSIFARINGSTIDLGQAGAGADNFWKTLEDTTLGTGAIVVSSPAGSGNAIEIYKLNDSGVGDFSYISLTESIVGGGANAYMSAIKASTGDESYVSLGTGDVLKVDIYGGNGDGDYVGINFSPGEDDAFKVSAYDATSDNEVIVSVRPGQSDMFKASVSGSATNTSPNLLRLSHLTSGDPAANYGSSLVFGATMQQSGAEISQTTLRSIWTDVNVGAEFSSFEIGGYYNGAAQNFLRIGKNTKGTSAVSLELGPDALGAPVRIEPKNASSTMSLYGNRLGPTISHAYDMTQSSGTSWGLNMIFDTSDQTGTVTFDGINFTLTKSGRASSGASNILNMSVDSANVLTFSDDGVFTIKSATAPAGNPSSGQSYLYIDASDGHIKQKISDGTVYDLTTGTGGSSAGAANEVQKGDGSGNFVASGVFISGGDITMGTASTAGDRTISAVNLSGAASLILSAQAEIKLSASASTVEGSTLNINPTSGDALFRTTLTNGNIKVEANGTGYVQIHQKAQFWSSGLFQLSEMSAPGTTPASGKGYIYIDSSDSKLKFKNDQGNVYDLTGSGGGGTPGGADGAAQYNNGGSFGGITPLVYNDSTEVLTYNDNVVETVLWVDAVESAGVVTIDCQNADNVRVKWTNEAAAVSLILENVSERCNLQLNILKVNTADTVITLDDTNMVFRGINVADLETTPELTLSDATANTSWEINIEASGHETAGGGGVEQEEAAYVVATAGQYGFHINDRHGETIEITNGGELNRFLERLFKNNSGSALTGNVVVEVYSITGSHGTDGEPDSLLATSDNVAIGDVPTGSSNAALIEFLFSGADRITLTLGTVYAFVVYYAGSVDSSNALYIDWAGDGSAEPGNYFYSNEGGAWTTGSDHDNIFELYSLSAGGSAKPILVVGGPAEAT